MQHFVLYITGEKKKKNRNPGPFMSLYISVPYNMFSGEQVSLPAACCVIQGSKQARCAPLMHLMLPRSLLRSNAIRANILTYLIFYAISLSPLHFFPHLALGKCNNSKKLKKRSKEVERKASGCRISRSASQIRK